MVGKERVSYGVWAIDHFFSGAHLQGSWSISCSAVDVETRIVLCTPFVVSELFLYEEAVVSTIQHGMYCEPRSGVLIRAFRKAAVALLVNSQHCRDHAFVNLEDWQVALL